MTIRPLPPGLDLAAVGGGLLLLVGVPFYLLTLQTGVGIPRDGTSLVVGRDFLNLWMVGRAAWEPDPARYYDIATYLAALGEQVGAGYPGQLWSYPPSSLLIGAPFGLLPYLPALLLWTLTGLGALAAALRLWTRDWRVIGILLASPAALFGLLSGQFACLAAAIILSVLHWRESRPWLAGALLGLLTVKPQLGLLFPVLLLVTGNWRAILSACATALGLALAVALLWGPDIWRVYLVQGIANQSLVLSDPDHLAGPFMATLFMNLRSAGVSIPVASAVQTLLSIAAVALTVWHFRARPAAEDRKANLIFLACAVSVTPYMLSYDTLAVAAMAVLVIARGEGNSALLLLFYLPLLQMVAGPVGIPGLGLVPIALVWMLLRGHGEENRDGELKFSRIRP